MTETRTTAGIYSINANGVNGTNTLRYIHADAQGSIVALTNEGGAAVERLSYDAWGKRRNSNGTDDTTHNLQAVNTDHGYTGHEHLDAAGLIHMNGRVYDPRLGRFIEADPYIQSPGNLQSFNRYSYVRNNPFFYTDPSGYFSLSDLDPSQSVKNFVSNIANQTMNELGANKYVGGLLQMGFLSSPIFGPVYGWSTGDWNSVGRAVATSAVMAATMWAGGAAWGAYTSAPGLMSGGIFITESAATSYASSYTTARIYGATNDQARHGALLAAKRGAVMAGARVGYQGMVGWDADPNPGKDDPAHTAYDPEAEGKAGPQTMDVVGENKILTGDFWSDFSKQGGALGTAMNKVEGINAVAHLHDVWWNTLPDDGLLFKIFNYPSMLPAAAITYPALMPTALPAALSVKPMH